MRLLRLMSQHLSRISNPKPSSSIRQFTSAAQATSSSSTATPPPPVVSVDVSSIAEELSGLTLLEVSDLTDVLRNKLEVKEVPIMAVMMPGMGFGGGIKGAAEKGGGAGGGAAKGEKAVFDVKLEGFDAAAKIKVIKDVRGFTELGLKEAKDLVEKSPTLLKKGVTKEEAENIIAKMKEVGAKVSME